MYSVLIADEKDYNRKGTKQKLLRLFNCIEIVGEANNGNDALSKILESSPDIVIIDSWLPGMNGLECIAEAKRSGSSALYIVVSDHDNFSYVQHALQLGVCDYLLKPINNDNLFTAVTNAIRSISQNQDKQQLASSIPHNTATPFHKANQMWLNLLCSQHSTSTACYKLAEETGAPFMHKFFSVFSVKTTAYHGERVSKETRGLVNYSIYSLLKTSLAGHADFHCFFSKNDGCVNAIISHSLSNDNLDRILDSFVKTIYNDTLIECRIGICNTCTEFDDLSALISETRKLIQYSIPMEHKSVVRSKSLLELVELDKYEPDSGLVTYIVHTCQNTQPDFSIIRSAAADIVADLISQKCNYASLKNACTKLLYTVASGLMSNIRHTDTPDILDHFATAFDECESIDDFSSILAERLWDLGHYFERLNLSEGRKIVSKIKTRIKAEYNQNIKLSSFAADYFINQSYLSALFQQETGLSFSQYLTDVRMEKAKEILASTSLSTGKVADLVGYNDRNYFAAVFSKHHNMTPVQYRKLVSDGKLHKEEIASSDDTR